MHLFAPRRLEQIVAADDVGLENAIPGLLDRLAAEMHDAVDAVDEFFDLGEIGEIGLHESLVARHVGGRANIAPAQVRIDAVKKLAQPGADAARRARHQTVCMKNPRG